MELLLELGRIDDAEGVLDVWEGDARRVARVWVLAHVTRCRGFVAAAHGAVDRAASLLQQAVVQHALENSGIAFDREAFHSTVRVKRGVNTQGRTLTYLLNYSSTPVEVKYGGPAAHDVLTGKPVIAGQMLSIQPWDLVIAESDGGK